MSDQVHNQTAHNEPDPQDTAPAIPASESRRMVLTMGAVGLLASILLVATYTLTAPAIEANLAAYLESSIRDVLTEADTRTDWRIVGDDVVLDDGTFSNEPRLFAGFREDGSLQGIAIEAQGQGYADVIRLIYGYSPDCGCIIGLKVLESKETPGLGDKIGKDPDFLSNFNALDVRLDKASGASSGATTGPLELIKQGSNLSAWQIDAISGATISSVAVTDILNASNQIVLPLIHAHLDQLSTQDHE